MSNDRFDKETNSDCNIMLDDMGIPILEDIILDDTEALFEDTTPGPNLSLPDNDDLVEALRNQLRSHIQQNLDDITAKVANKVADKVRESLERKINSQLNKILTHNLDKIINSAIVEAQRKQ